VTREVDGGLQTVKLKGRRSSRPICAERAALRQPAHIMKAKKKPIADKSAAIMAST